MKFLKRMFAPKEVRVAIGILDEVGLEFDCEAFHIVRNGIEDAYLWGSTSVVSHVKNGISPRQQVYTSIANLAGDYLESGQYHLYRGVLNPLGPGEDFLKLFHLALDNLVQSGAIDDKEAEEQRKKKQEGIQG